MQTEIGIEQLKFIREALYSNSAVGKLVMINLHAQQLEAGVDFCLLETPSYPIEYLTPTWLISVQNFMSDHNIQMTITDQPCLSPQSSTDEFIMQRDHLKRYTITQQRDINSVRLYLQATTLADLTDPNRPQAISLCSLDGKRYPDFKVNPHWPRQPEPAKHQKRLWKRYISSSFLRYIPMWKTPPLLAHAPLQRQLNIPQPAPTSTPVEPTTFTTLKAASNRYSPYWHGHHPPGEDGSDICDEHDCNSRLTDNDSL
jgi:hypothetical protein